MKYKKELLRGLWVDPSYSLESNCSNLGAAEYAEQGPLKGSLKGSMRVLFGFPQSVFVGS